MMGMGFNFITSPDSLEPPPAAARSCLDNSLSPGADNEGSENSSANSSGGVPSFMAAAAVSMLGLFSFL